MALWIIPKQLKRARERISLSREEAAKKAEVPVERLQLWEEGEGSPTLEEAQVLAEVYKTNLRSFLEVKPEPAQRLDLRLEKPDETAAVGKSLREARALFEHWCQIVGELDNLLGRRETSLKQVLTDNPVTLAQELRMQYELGTRPIKGLRELFEDKMGVLVFALPVENVSGMSWWHPSAGPAILVNRNDIIGRQNWTLAHELAHILTTGDMFLCDTVYLNESDEREQFANRFAAELLLPKEEILEHVRRQELEKQLQADNVRRELARRYAVSREAITWRLEGLGYLHRGFTLAHLPQRRQKRIERPGWGRRTPLRERRIKELGERLVERGIKAYLEEKITLSKLAEDLDLGIVEADQMVEEWGKQHSKPCKG